MSDAYRNTIGDAGAALITHIGLVDEADTEIAGGDPAYARQAVTWVAASDGIIRPNANLVFNVPASTTVAGWRGYTALTAGTDRGGADVTNEVFAAQGTYTLLAASSGVNHANPA